jgi:hypothetical protein
LIDGNQPSVKIVSPLVANGTIGSINEELCHVNNILYQLKVHIPVESDSLDTWREFVQTDNGFYHCDPDINTILMNSSELTAQYNQYKTTILTGFFKAIANNQSLAP